MIKNEKQYLMTMKQIRHFQKALEQSQKSKVSIDPMLYEAMLQGIRVQILDLEKEVEEYTALKRGTAHILVQTLQDIPLALIKTRIAKGLSQKQLALLLHMKEQQLQRYEATNYQGVGFEKVVKIAEVLGMNMSS